MTLSELKQKIGEYQYFEDTGVIDVALASVIATRLRIGDPVWMIVIGASSGGKSQILRPLALTDTKYMHKIDDLTENTFLSGAKTKEGENSLLLRIGGSGILVMSDLTVLFSKAKEQRAAILAQFRMIYDGEMVKHSGSKGKATEWKGALGVLAGSTPTIYTHFEEVADMGQRFIYYRMKDYDAEKATRMALSRDLFGKKLDVELAGMYDEYMKGVVKSYEENGEIVKLSDEIVERIISVSLFAERVRTTAHVDPWGAKKNIDKIPTVSFPMRVALQLMSLAMGLAIMKRAEGGEMGDDEMKIIDWCGWSLANEEKRACLQVLVQKEWGSSISTQAIADVIGLDTSVIGNVLQNMSAVGVLERTGDASGLRWSIKNERDWKIISDIVGIENKKDIVERSLTIGDDHDISDAVFDLWPS